MLILIDGTDLAALEPALRELATRGHRTELAFVGAKAVPKAADELAAELELVRLAVVPKRRDHWTPLIEAFRVPNVFAGLKTKPLLRTRPGHAALDRLAVWIERAIPTADEIDAELHARAMDAVVLTSRAQRDWLLSARRAGARARLVELGAGRNAADAVETLMGEPWPQPVRTSAGQQAAWPLLWLLACSPNLPKIKGLRRSPRAERVAERWAARQKKRRRKGSR